MEYIKRKFEIAPGEFTWFCFEWDDAKSEYNKSEHEINFDEAVDLLAENYNGTIQSEAATKTYLDRDPEERQQIRVVDQSQRTWRIVFIVKEREINGYTQHLIRLISCHRRDK